MTKSQACQPCAKRKVRCDHGVPCSSCKRLKIAHCTYPNVSPQDRINQLEALVEELRGNTGGHVEKLNTNAHTGFSNPRVNSLANDDDLLLLTTLQSQFHGKQVSSSRDIRSNDPVELEENGQSFHMESRTCQLPMLRSTGQVNRTKWKPPRGFQELPHALAGTNANLIDPTFCKQYPATEYATILWDMFMDRVDPLVRICYRWWLKDFRAKALNVDTCQELSTAEHALLSVIYLISTVSMSQGECESLLHQPRKTLITEHERISADALQRTDLFCMNNIVVMQAVTFYLVAGYNRLSAQSLWSLTGLAIRSAERLDMHREGMVPGLRPAQIEERRRVWWQLQQIDLGMAIRSGITSMTLVADWDANMPLNIEDEDISATSAEFPRPRKGLTSMSFCRYFCFVLDQQRKSIHTKQGRHAPSQEYQQSDQTALRDIEIEQLEENLNEEFLRYCDPIKPPHVLLQLSARFMVAIMWLRTLHSRAYKDERGSISHEDRKAILEIAMQCLEYRNASQSHPMLQKYRWMTTEWVPFQAFILVLVEAAHEENPDKAQKMWDLLSNTYANNSNLWELWEDRRKYQAAELVVIAWRTWQKRFGIGLHLSNPSFVEDLERELVKQKQKTNEETFHDPLQPHTAVTPLTPDTLGAVEGDVDAIFDVDFQDVDWSFWSSID